jgi:hypothetical protein
MNLTRRGFLATTAVLSGSQSLRAGEPAGLRERLLGAWRLLEAVTVFANGATGPWYDRPGPYTGLIIYTGAGAMSVQIASARPAAHSPPSLEAMAAAEQLRYLNSYYAYFGRFEVNEAGSEVSHAVESSLDPTEVGLTYTQEVTLARDRLTLTTQPWRVRNSWRHSRLTWARERILSPT